MAFFSVSPRAALATLATAVITSLAAPGLKAAPGPSGESIVPSSSTNLEWLSPTEAAAAANSGRWKVLDVRTVPPLDYINGHLPQAVHLAEQTLRGPNGKLPFQIWAAPELASLFGRAGIGNKDSVLVYSDGSNILGATLAAYTLEKSGIPKIALVNGGYTGYKNSGSPTTKIYPSYQQVSFKPTAVQGLAIKLPELSPLIGKKDVIIVDPRPKAQYEGIDQSFQRNGHIPGAINLPWQQLTEANNPDATQQNASQLKSLDDLRKVFVSRGVTPDKTVIISCSTGREASLQFLVLKHLLKYPNVKIYEGSWTEYSATKLPLETGPDPSQAH